jgi:hypothetical protein
MRAIATNTGWFGGFLSWFAVDGLKCARADLDMQLRVLG